MSANKTTNQIDQPNNKHVDSPASQPTNQSINHSINQSINQSINWSDQTNIVYVHAKINNKVPYNEL